MLGAGFILGARWISPLTPAKRYFHNFTYGIDYKDFDDSSAGATIAKINYSQLSIEYSGTYISNTYDIKGTLGLTFAPSALGNDEAEFSDKRVIENNKEAEPNYSYWKLGFVFNQHFEWGHSLHLDLGAQFTESLLISNEQFSLGGSETVRGYLDSQASGDYGVFGQFELISPDLFQESGIFKKMNSFVFADAGTTKLIAAGSQQTDKFSLSSLGLGLKAQSAKDLFLNVAWAYPLEASGNIDKGDDRFHFSLGIEF